ncbi:helix-turn-helix domain-containing protein [Vitreimonas flagellata]|uniref:helix-turn-helix domain-containing protein n=1 Tax=Vitreimonas flagellata TaxID=2560861 RepID=UPI001074E045|nr:helix-turn-helix domain-containing protein [Vitreimonas flagellata]
MDQLARSPKQIGAALRRRRRALKLTQAALATQASLRQATVSSAEAGEPMQLETLFSLLTALDLELVLRTRTKGVLRGGDA